MPRTKSCIPTWFWALPVATRYAKNGCLYESGISIEWGNGKSFGKLEVVIVFRLYEGERHFIKILNTEHYAPLDIVLNRLEVQR